MYREKPTVKETVEVVGAAPVQDADLPACAHTENDPAGAGVEQPTSNAAVDFSASGVMHGGESGIGFAAGGGSTSGHADGHYGRDKALLWAGKRLAIASIAFSSLFSYFAVHILAGHFFWRMTDIQATEYMHSTLDASSIGVLICFLCYIRLSRTLAGLKENRFLTICRCLAGAFLIFVLASAHGLFGALAGVLACLGFIGIGWLGRQIIAAVPASFRFGRAIMWAGLASCPAALLALGAVYNAVVTSRPADYVSTYSDHTSGELAALLIFIWLLVTIPTYALARNARTSEVKPLVALGLLQHSPLLFGIALQLAILSTGANALPMVAAGSIALLATVALIALGGATAAKVNGIKHRRKMKAAGGSLLE